MAADWEPLPDIVEQEALMVEDLDSFLTSQRWGVQYLGSLCAEVVSELSCGEKKEELETVTDLRGARKPRGWGVWSRVNQQKRNAGASRSKGGAAKSHRSLGPWVVVVGSLGFIVTFRRSYWQALSCWWWDDRI